MSADDDLAAGPMLHAGQHLRDETHDVGMERELGLFQEKGAHAVQHHPKQPE